MYDPIKMSVYMPIHWFGNQNGRDHNLVPLPYLSGMNKNNHMEWSRDTKVVLGDNYMWDCFLYDNYFYTTRH